MPIIGAVVGLISGLAGTKAMELATTKMYEAQSEEDKRREKRVQPKYASVVAAERTAGLFGARLDDQRAQRLGTWFHYGLGVSWGVIYLIVRALTGWHPLAVGLGIGLTMFLLIDEAMNTALGFAASPDRYPLATHMRGLVGHLVYGLVVAVAAEAMLALVGIVL